MELKVAIIADLHIPDCSTELPETILRNLKDADMIVCAGDITEKSTLEELQNITLVEAVYGKKCSMELQSQLPFFRKVDLNGFSLGITHSGGFPLLQTPRLLRFARQRKCGFIVFGKTHRPMYQEIDEVVLINPGSPTCPADGFPPSMAILYLGKRSFRVEMLTF